MKPNGKIIGFVCKFCALASFDLGPPPDIASGLELVEVPCAGRVDARAVLTAFESGADAVFVAGCRTHECLNLSGSSRAEKRLARVGEILDFAGLGRNRLAVYHVSGTHGPRFDKIAAEMAEQVSRLGPNPLSIRKQPERSVDHDCCRAETAAGNN